MLRRFLIGALVASWTGWVAVAQEVPALSGLSGAEKARVAELIEAAKKEGGLSYWDGVIQPETHDRLSAAFRKHYGFPGGFQVNYTLSATSALVTKVEQEVGAGRVSIDVAAVAAPSWAFELSRKGGILEYDSPQYRHYSAALARGLGRNNYFAFNGAYFFVPMWNADTLKFKGKSWKDVAGAVPAGRATVGDAAKSMPYLATFMGVEKALGWEIVAKMAELKPAFILRSEQSMGRLAANEDLMSLTGMPTRAYQYNRKGANLKFMMPEEGIVLIPQSMFILAKAPHPSAAKLWVDFVLSEEGQKILVAEEALVSGRSGFTSPLPDYAPAIDTLKLIELDWSSISTDDLKRLRERWVQTFNP